jgi:transglutaminase-like putative cysteine protease
MPKSVSADVQPIAYDVAHVTRYAYTELVSVSHHLARLTPRTFAHQSRLRHAIEVEPAAAVQSTHTDYFGNEATFFAMQGAHRGLTVTSRSRVRVTARAVPAASRSRRSRHSSIRRRCGPSPSSWHTPGRRFRRGVRSSKRWSI